MTATNDLAASALDYANRGWAIFPIWPPVFLAGEDTVTAICSCPKRTGCPTSPGKHPKVLWRNGNGTSLVDMAATKDPDTVHRWWTAWPDASIGIATGRISGIYVIDVDKRGAGWDTLGKLDQARGFPFDTLRVFTPSGGAHFYFTHPGIDVATGSNVLGPGVDLRGDGGMVVAPPSLHKSRGRYIWHYQVDPTGPREARHG